MMANAIVFYILFKLTVLTYGQTTSSLWPSTFLGHSIEYEDPDISVCDALTTVMISNLDQTTTASPLTISSMGFSIQYENITLTDCNEIITTTEIPVTYEITTEDPFPTSYMNFSILYKDISTNTCDTTATTIATLTTSFYKQNLVFVAPPCPNNMTIGSSCNISVDACSLLQPCLNLATCQLNMSLPLGYICKCTTGFYGTYCELDQRDCRPGVTCFNGGVCNGSDCVCASGKTGDYCQTEINVCGNVKCENNAQCVSSYGNWSCRCTDNTVYSGTYCEIKSSTLLLKEMITRSLGSVAIGCILAVVTFIFIMDALKYCFKIDPIDNSVRSSKKGRKRYERKKAPIKAKKPVIAVRFQYIHA